MSEEDQNIVKRAVSSVTELANRVSGRELNERIESFADTFAEVLVGIHQDQEKLARAMEDEARKHNDLEERISSLERQLRETAEQTEGQDKLQTDLVGLQLQLQQLHVHVKSMRRLQPWLIATAALMAVLAVLLVIFA